MPRLILVLLDGLHAAAADARMGFMAALVENGDAVRHTLSCALPPLSRPLYATLLTGRAPAELGIFRNDDARLCPAPTLFHHAREAGLVTAAAAYYWFSELCNRAPFVPERDRLTLDPTLPISHGLFYRRDDYPDEELFGDAEALYRRFSPHLLLVHSMNIDNAGHLSGGDSAAYRQAAREADGLLARHVPRWLAEGCALCVTSDHGMHPDGWHDDLVDEVRRVPLWFLGDAWRAPLAALGRPPRQTDLAALCRALLLRRESRAS